MSRIGNKPVPIADGAKVAISGRTIEIEGPKGKLSYEHRPEVKVAVDDDNKTLVISRSDEERASREFHGLTRALIANMVEGVTKGYEKRLEIVGVGYLAAIQGDVLQLRVGFANELHKKIPKELNVTCPDQTHVVVQGCDKQKVGQFAAEVRALRKPEPYKGKGVRYQGEQVKIKPGKSATK
ncbi:MAG: 50S ribosomal protein L6 [Planctomycetota bacterium]|nr:50S ribosomal protein L6 [Planctomycetota bacterium]